MSSSDSEDEGVKIVRLDDIPTVAQLYAKDMLEDAPKDKTRYPADADGAFLDRVCLFQGDITAMEVDSIVNAANRSLLGGGGVDGAIHARAGRALLEECASAVSARRLTLDADTYDSDVGETLDGCETGSAKITKAYKLPSKHIIHAVGPVYSRSDLENRAKQLASCYSTSLKIAVENGLKHITSLPQAFCSISTGIYGYPIVDATHIALDTVRQFCESEDGSKLDRIIFVVWSNKDKDVYETLIPEYFPRSSDAGEERAASEAPAGDTTTTEQDTISEELSQLPEAPPLQPTASEPAPA
ncbi:Macro domain-containing protein [Mycena kentingensis (nom. inval.)]|nr:Macro domain-containing protein [Mycena kentingensis (nom. inval.)]